MRDYIKDVAIVCGGHYHKMLEMIQKRVSVPHQRCRSHFVVYGEPHYPKCFYRLQYPPLVLFYYGQLDLLNQNCVSVVGSRQCDQYGIEKTRWLVNQLKSQFVIVSGLAKGIDCVAHQTALKTVAYLGSGIDYIYPYENRELYQRIKSNHLILSEFPNDISPLKYHFPWRNRLIAASSRYLMVMSATIKSGSMHTAHEAMKMDSDLYCLPYPLGNPLGEGCHGLINEGANIITEIAIKDLISIHNKGGQ